MTCSVMFKYRTYMNTVAISPHLIIKMLQKLNVKWDIVNKISNTITETQSWIKEEPDGEDKKEKT